MSSSYQRLICFLWKNSYTNATWPYRLTVRTEAFQALNRGSIPRRVTYFRKQKHHGQTTVLKRVLDFF